MRYTPRTVAYTLLGAAQAVLSDGWCHCAPSDSPLVCRHWGEPWRCGKQVGDGLTRPASLKTYVCVCA